MARIASLDIITICAFIFIVFLIYPNVEQVIGQIPVSVPGAENYPLLLHHIDLEAIKAHVKYFSNFGSRVTGYPGAQEAANYIFNFFMNVGLENVTYEYYDITIPVDYGANITVLSPVERVLNAYPLWPCSVQPSPTPDGGITGHLVYVGKGSLSDFSLKRVNDCIVLMDFNSDDNWLNALRFGAKAVVFIEPDMTTSSEAFAKTAKVPLYFPRVYVKRDEGEALKNLASLGAIVRLESKMRWETRRGINIVGYVKGLTKPESKMTVSSYYDSISIVPSLAPGADEAIGVSTLLEMAKFFAWAKANGYGPERTIVFVALSGHNQELTGAGAFLDRYFIEMNATNPTNWRLAINLDISADSQSFGIYHSGSYYYTQLWYSGTIYYWLAERLFKQYPAAIKAQTGLELSPDGRGLDADYRDYIFTSWKTDSEVFAYTGQWAVSIMSYPLYRITWNTPLDTYERFQERAKNIENQVIYSFLVIYSLSKEPEINPDAITWKLGGPSGRGTYELKGQVIAWNDTKGWYEPVPGAIVNAYSFFAVREHGRPQLTTGEHSLFTIADENGYFKFISVPRVQIDGIQKEWIKAYVVDQESGSILYGPDLGSYGAGTFPDSFLLERNPWFTNVVVFRCASIILTDFFDPTTLRPLSDAQLSVYGFFEHVPEIHFGYLLDSTRSLGVVFIPPNKSIEILVFSPLKGYPIAIFTNASESEKSGSGFFLSWGGNLVISYAPLRAAKDLYWLVDSRVQMLRVQSVESASVSERHLKTEQLLRDADYALEKSNYQEALSRAYLAWATELNAYEFLRGLMGESLNAIVTFSVLLVPFSFFMERLLIESRELKRRALGMAISFIFGLVTLYVLHPGFRLASSVPIVMAGFITLILTAPILAIVISKLYGYIKVFIIKARGIHFIERAFIASLVTSFSVGTSNMRRRRMRTTLTLMSLIIVMMSLVLFTSAATLSFVTGETIATHTPYNGILIKLAGWEPLLENTMEILQAQFGSDVTISYRSWFVPKIYEIATGPGGKSVHIPVLLGMTNEEVLPVEECLANGRWFEQGEDWSIILSDALAKQLGAKIGDTVTFQSISFKVIGVFNASRLDAVTDLDGETITPVIKEEVGGGGFGKGAHIPAVSVAIIPYRIIGLLGQALRATSSQTPYSVSVLFRETNKVIEVAKEIASEFIIDVFAGVNGTLTIYRAGTAYKVTGWEMIIIPSVIIALLVLNLMLSTIYERTREIGIFASVGLSPLHVTGLFLAESMIFAVVASILGYLAGISTTIVVYTSRIMPAGFYPNFSSSFVLLTMLFSILIVLASTIFPAYKASRLVTPSLERVWKIPTKPKGDIWSIPQPFKFESQEGAKGILEFMREYLSSFTIARGLFQVIGMNYEEHDTAERSVRALVVDMRLAPFEMGLSQRLHIILQQDLKGLGQPWVLEFLINRLSGNLSLWQRRNREVVYELRRQLLIYIGLPSDKRRLYEKAAESELFKLGR